MNITGNTIVGVALECFPEALPSYEAMVKEWHGEFPGTYNVFYEVFRPLLSIALQENDLLLQQRFSQFFEIVLRDGDAEAQNVIWLKIFKWLFGQKNLLELFLPVCGPATRRAMRNAAFRWNVSWSMRLKLLLC